MKWNRTRGPGLVLSILAAVFSAGVVSGAAPPTLPIPQVGGDPHSPALEGLWSYTAIAPRGRSEMPLSGLFLFHDGIFIQQAVNDGEPFDRQLGQAHTGTYRAAEKDYGMIAELAIGVSPSRTPALSLRRDTEHEIAVEHRGDELVLTFGSGTVQKFKRIGSGDGQVYVLDEGRLALVDGHFVLVAARDGAVVAGSGRFERSGESVSFHAMRWFYVKGDEIAYEKDQAVDATFDGRVLTLADGAVFRVK